MSKNKPGEFDRILKELRQIRNLLILSLLKSGATTKEVNYATGMGAENISRMFPVKKGKRGKITSSEPSNTSL